MSETRSRTQLRVAMSGLSPDALKALAPRPEPQSPFIYKGAPVSWAVVRGFAVAPVVGLAMGFVAMILVGWLMPGFGDPGLSDQTRVLRMASCFGLILSVSPFLAATAMFALGHGKPYQVALAVALSWLAFGSSGWAAQAMSAHLALVPPEWLMAAAAL